MWEKIMYIRALNLNGDLKTYVKYEVCNAVNSILL